MVNIESGRAFLRISYKLTRHRGVPVWLIGLIYYFSEAGLLINLLPWIFFSVGNRTPTTASVS